MMHNTPFAMQRNLANTLMKVSQLRGPDTNPAAWVVPGFPKLKTSQHLDADHGFFFASPDVSIHGNSKTTTSPRDTKIMSPFASVLEGARPSNRFIDIDRLREIADSKREKQR
jgi:hypothetical protein